MSALVAVVAAGVACYALRVSTVMLLTRWPLPPRFARSMRFVAPAMVAALLVTTLAGQARLVDAGDAAARAVALAVAAFAAVRLRSAGAAVAAGLPAFWAVSALGTLAG